MYSREEASQFSLMEREEQMAALRRVRNGDAEARNRVILSSMRLVFKIAGKYKGWGIEYDDLISIGTIGLIKAVDTFDPENGVAFYSYAVRCIGNEMLMALRKRKREKKTVALEDAHFTGKDGSVLMLLDTLKTEDDLVSLDIEHKADLEMLRGHVSMLTRRQVEIIRLRYGESDCTQGQIADRFGISQSSISRTERRALQSLREAMLAE